MKKQPKNPDYQLTQDRQAAMAVRSYLNPLPRSIMRSGEYELLDGEWRFELDLEDKGLREHWYLGHAYTQTAIWPRSVEEHLAAGQDYQQKTRPWHDKVVAWYERDFYIPEHWINTATNLVQVTFGACGYETRVWFNGHPLTTLEGEEVHFGGYTSFTYELPPAYFQPQNRLTVRIAHSLDADIPRGKQESHVYRRGGIWYQTITGAVRSIWIEPIERNRLRSQLSVMTHTAAQLAEFNLVMRVQDPGSYTLRLVVTAQGEETPLAISEYTLPLAAGERRQQVALPLPGAGLWSTAQPQLYQLVAQLRGPDGNVSQIETHFGLRKIETRNHELYLNNKAIYLDGILYQPGRATFEQMHAHLLAMKALGCNLVRVHIAGIDPRIYDMADELGLLLWVEVPSPHNSSQVSRANHWAELQRLLVIIASHPSVIICSLYNEDWGAQDIATNPETQGYIARVYQYMQVNYPQFLVVDNDGWQHVSVEGRITTDLLTAHVYTTGIDHWADCLDRLRQGEIEGVTAFPLVVGDPFFYRGQLPLIVSEWGGFGFEGYGGPADPAGKAKRIRAFKLALRRRAIGGDVYTQAVSIEEEVNGLIEPETGKLLVPENLLRSQPRRKGRGRANKTA